MSHLSQRPDVPADVLDGFVRSAAAEARPRARELR